MGMFDEVVATCPECCSAVVFQSKAGPCTMKQFDADAVPPTIAEDIEGDVVCCEDCGRPVQIEYDDEPPKAVRMIAL